MDRIENLATEFKRPAAGFSLVPALLNAAMQGNGNDTDKMVRHHHHRRQQVSAMPNMHMYPPLSAKSQSAILNQHYQPKNEMIR